jgi:hypothetical protein
MTHGESKMITKRSVLMAVVILLAATMCWAQDTAPQNAPAQTTRRPPYSMKTQPPSQPNYIYFSILDGTPEALELHHDTVQGTGQPVDVYMLALELQVMNSDGDSEPEGLIIDHFYTAKAVQPQKALNPHDARDCGFWYQLVQGASQNRNPMLRTWPYMEFTVAEGARVIQTNEDGAVYWSDDIECWGSSDRFPPF